MTITEYYDTLGEMAAAPVDTTQWEAFPPSNARPIAEVKSNRAEAIYHAENESRAFHEQAASDYLNRLQETR